MATSSNKPTFNVNPGQITDTILSTTQQDVKDARGQTTTKAVNAYGISVLRGGSTLGSSFLTSVFDAYANVISYRPFALFLMLIGTLYFLSLTTNTVDPFTATHNHVLAYHKEANQLVHKKLMAAFAGVVGWMKDYKEFFGLVCIVYFPYLSKPSTRNAYISTILLVYCIMFKLTPLACISLGHLFFLMVQLRNPVHKAIIVTLAIITIFLGHETISNIAGIKK